MSLTLHKDAQDDESKFACCERLKSLLIAEHNAAAQTMKPAEFAVWERTEFRPRMKKVLDERNQYRAELEKDAKYDPKLADSFAPPINDLKETAKNDTKWDSAYDFASIEKLGTTATDVVEVKS